MNTDKLIAKIKDEISRNGGNKHKYPISMGEHAGEWHVIVEVDSKTRTFDISTTAATLPAALDAALSHIRRNYAHPNR